MDTGANFTAFHKEDTNIIDILTTKHIQASGPSGAAMHSVGEAKYKARIPTGMPSTIFNGHRIPALQQHSILSIGKLSMPGVYSHSKRLHVNAPTHAMAPYVREKEI